MGCPTTPCMTKVFQALAANLVPEPLNPVRMLELAVGGGKTPRPRSAVYTIERNKKAPFGGFFEVPSGFEPLYVVLQTSA